MDKALTIRVNGYSFLENASVSISKDIYLICPNPNGSATLTFNDG